MGPLHYLENGSKDKDAIVFVHGGGMTGLGWQTALQAIPEYYRLAPDLPGSGRSAHIAPLTLENAVEGLALIIGFAAMLFRWWRVRGRSSIFPTDS